MMGKIDRVKIGRSNVSTSKVHERRVARLLTDWSGVPFRRRRVQGRDSAVRVVELVADIMACAGEFHYSIECKKEKGFSFDSLMANPLSSLFTSWWHQTCYDASILSQTLERVVYPMLFFKPNPMWDWIAFSAKSIGLLKPIDGRNNVNGLWFSHLVFDAFGWLGPISGNVSHSRNKKIVELNLDQVIICRWSDFAASVAPQSAFALYPTPAELATLQGD